MHSLGMDLPKLTDVPLYYYVVYLSKLKQLVLATSYVKICSIFKADLSEQISFKNGLSLHWRQKTIRITPATVNNA